MMALFLFNWFVWHKGELMSIWMVEWEILNCNDQNMLGFDSTVKVYLSIFFCKNISDISSNMLWYPTFFVLIKILVVS